jgi:type I restriction-modification system DNA methylase subunit
MPKSTKADKQKAQKNGANLGFEQKLWQAADKLRGSMDASDYKHVVLGLIFLKYIFRRLSRTVRETRGRASRKSRRSR